MTLAVDRAVKPQHKQKTNRLKNNIFSNSASEPKKGTVTMEILQFATISITCQASDNQKHAQAVHFLHFVLD